MFCQFDHCVIVPGIGTLCCYLLGSNFHLWIYCTICPDLLMTYRGLIDVFQTFSIDKGFFCMLSITDHKISVFEEFFDFLIRWQASISLHDTLTPILSKVSITFSSRFWLSTSSGIPVTSRLLLQPCCSKRIAVFFQCHYFVFQVVYFIA